MRSSLAKYQQATPMSDEEIKRYEQRLYNETGKGIVHPSEFAEVYVRQQVEKLFIKKYGSKHGG
jgi:hypothetical protein